MQLCAMMVMAVMCALEPSVRSRPASKKISNNFSDIKGFSPSGHTNTNRARPATRILGLLAYFGTSRSAKH